MSDTNSVLTRVPAEVWRRILLEVMHVPYLLDTTCVGSFFQLWRAIDIDSHWRRSEWQRKLLRRVCKSWKHFAETKAYRSIESQDWQQEPHVLAHAQRAQLCKPLGHMLTTPTRWEVVEIDHSDMVDEFLVSAAQGYHPRLRRLCIPLNPQTNQFCLFVAREPTAFFQFTFLHVRLPWRFYSHLPIAIDVRATLPNLEVLIWEDFEGTNTPSTVFRLPTLHHFGWYNRDGCFPLSTLLTYASTLHSLSILNVLWSGNTLLPDLNEFPHLEELSINAAFEIKDPKPVPPTYPLHTIHLNKLGSATVHGVMQILQYCNPVKLRRIPSSNLLWENGGEPGYVYNNVHDREEIVRLADMCQERGIRVEDSKGRVRFDMPPAVELSDFAFWCVRNHSIGCDVHTLLGIWLWSQPGSRGRRGMARVESSGAGQEIHGLHKDGKSLSR